jgi:hypothetical protein
VRGSISTGTGNLGTVPLRGRRSGAREIPDAASDL